MAITVPVTGDEISASTFGAPVANALNALNASPVVAYKESNVTQSGVANGTVTPITGMSVTFTALATHVYRVTYQAAMTGTAAGQWLMTSLTGGPITGSRYFASQPCSAQTGYGHGNVGSLLAGPGLTMQFSGSTTLQLNGNGVGAGTTWGVGGWCFIAVEDLGPF